eukprot:3937430-Rhodomonas_salina.1
MPGRWCVLRLCFLSVLRQAECSRSEAAQRLVQGGLVHVQHAPGCPPPILSPRRGRLRDDAGRPRLSGV